MLADYNYNLKAASAKTASASVGRVLPLRIAIMYRDQLLLGGGKTIRNPRQHSAFPSAFHQLMSLADTEAQDDEASFMKTLADLLLGCCSLACSRISRDELISLMTFWSKVVNANSFAIELPVGQQRTRQIGTVLYGGPCSFFNHSCDPNVTFIISEEKANVMVTTRSVKAGQELCISYGPTFAFRPRAEGRLTDDDCDGSEVYSSHQANGLQIVSTLKK